MPGAQGTARIARAEGVGRRQAERRTGGSAWAAPAAAKKRAAPACRSCESSLDGGRAGAAAYGAAAMAAAAAPYAGTSASGPGPAGKGDWGAYSIPQEGCPRPRTVQASAAPRGGGPCGCMCRHRRRRCRRCRKEGEGAGMGRLEAMRGPRGAAAGLSRSPGGRGIALSCCQMAASILAAPARASALSPSSSAASLYRGPAPFRGGPSSRGRRPGQGTPTRRRARA